MKAIDYSLVAATVLAGVAAFVVRASTQAEADRGPIFLTEIPAGYRDWRWISVAHEEGNFNSFAAVLGNDVASRCDRDGTLPFPDGAIIALHYRHLSSEENNKVFDQAQSFVAGTPTKVQFMVKDSAKYGASGRWGFGHFQDGKPADQAMMKSRFPCHTPAKERDFVVTRYAP